MRNTFLALESSIVPPTFILDLLDPRDLLDRRETQDLRDLQVFREFLDLRTFADPQVEVESRDLRDLRDA